MRKAKLATAGMTSTVFAFLLLSSAVATPAQAQASGAAACDFSVIPGAVYWTAERQMTAKQFASYAAPVYWFSPDEPVMEDLEGKELRLPETLPFQNAPDSPMVYFQFNRVINRIASDDPRLGDGPGYIPHATNKDDDIIDLHNAVAVNLKYIAYFSREEGLGGHDHDVEPAEFRIFITRSTDTRIVELGVECDELTYIMVVSRVTGEAHGLEWYFNVLEVDEYTRFPMHLIVEEGKHGLCTDKNADGYYTPGFDVNRRVNDAWGVRDIIRGGTLFAGGFESWMAKVRRPEHRSFPPLPDDSPLLDDWSEDGVYAPDNAIYDLRAFPSPENAEQELLHHKMEEKYQEDWPLQNDISAVSQFDQWAGESLALKSFAISLRADGDLGLSFVFPFFIFKNLEDPMAGGFLVHRIYLKDQGLRDFGWMLMYAPSASRWIDTYFAAGAEHDVEDVSPPPTDPEAPLTESDWSFVLETGLKFRVNITKSPLKFLAFLTEFMGFRAGIKNKGFFDIERLTYVFEFGAGVW